MMQWGTQLVMLDTTTWLSEQEEKPSWNGNKFASHLKETKLQHCTSVLNIMMIMGICQQLLQTNRYFVVRGSPWSSNLFANWPRMPFTWRLRDVVGILICFISCKQFRASDGGGRKCLGQQFDGGRTEITSGIVQRIIWRNIIALIALGIVLNGSQVQGNYPLANSILFSSVLRTSRKITAHSNNYYLEKSLLTI